MFYEYVGWMEIYAWISYQVIESIDVKDSGRL